MLRLDQPRRRFHFWNKWGPQVDCRLASYVAKTRPSEPNGRSAEPDNLFVLMNLGVPRHHTSYSALKTPLPEKDSISLVDIREVGSSSIPIHASSLSLSLRYRVPIALTYARIIRRTVVARTGDGRSVR